MTSTGDDQHFLVFEKIDLPIYKVVVDATKTVVLFRNSTLPKMFIPNAAVVGTGDMSPPDLSKMKSLYGPDYMTRLGLNRAFHTTGQRKNRSWTFRIATCALFGHETVSSLQEKVKSVIGSSDVYIWTWSVPRDPLQERRRLVDDVFGKSELGNIEGIANALRLRTDQKFKKSSRAPDYDGPLTRRRAFELLDDDMFAKVKMPCVFRYDNGDSATTVVHPIDPNDEFEDYDSIRLSPNVHCVQTISETIESFFPFENEFYCYSSSNSAAAAEKNSFDRFFFPQLDRAMRLDVDSSSLLENVILNVCCHPEQTLMRSSFALTSVFVTDVVVWTPWSNLESVETAKAFEKSRTSRRNPVVYRDGVWKISKSFVSDPNLHRVRRTAVTLKPNRILKWIRPWFNEDGGDSPEVPLQLPIVEVHTNRGRSSMLLNMKSVRLGQVFHFLEKVQLTTNIQQTISTFKIRCLTRTHNSIRSIASMSTDMLNVFGHSDDHVRFNFVDNPGTVVSVVASDSHSFLIKITVAGSRSYTVDQVVFQLKLTVRLLLVTLFNSISSSYVVERQNSAADQTGDGDDVDDADFLRDYFKDLEGLEDVALEGLEDVAGDSTGDVRQAEEEEEDGDIVANLKRADPSLFDYQVVDPSIHVKYSTLCQKQRQPVVVSPGEISKFDSGKRKYGNGVIAYGSTPELQKSNRYICPNVWCPRSRTPMSTEEFVANGRKCRDGGEAIVRSGTFPGYQNSERHPERLCVPCCFIKPKEGSLQRCQPKEEEGLNNKTSNSKYIVSHDIVLSKDRMGLLPPFLENVFGNVAIERGHRHDGTGFLTRSSSCFVRVGVVTPNFVRVGVVTPNSQPFLSCISRAIRRFDGDDGPADICRAIVRNMTVEQFVADSDGQLLVTFVRLLKKTDVSRIDLGESLERNPTYAKLYNLNTMALSEGEAMREKLVFSAFEKFKRYLEDDSIEKMPDILGNLLNKTLPWLNDRHRRFVYIDSEAKTMTTLLDEPSCEVSFVICRPSVGACEMVGRARMKDKRPTLSFDQDDLPEDLYRLIKAPTVPGDEEALKIYQDIHGKGDVVVKFIISYERSTIGFKTRNHGTVMLKSPSSMFDVCLGQSYEYDRSDVDLGIFLENYVGRDEKMGMSDDSIVADDRRRLPPRKFENAETIKLLMAMRNPSNPMPKIAKSEYLVRKLGISESLVDVLMDPTVRLSDVIDNGLYDMSMTVDDDENKHDTMITFLDDDDTTGRLSMYEFKEKLMSLSDPYTKRASMTVIATPVPKPKQSNEALTMKRNKDADIDGDFRPVGYKWRPMLKRFETLTSTDTLYDIFERVAVILGRKQTFRGGGGLKTIATAFIANDPELLALVTETNAAMLYLRGLKNIALVRNKILSGTCPPSFIETCVLSRLVDVRTIVLKRKTNGHDDDDSFVCMNNNPTSDPHPFTLIFQHKIDDSKQIDVFKPLLYDRTSIVNTDEVFSAAFKEIIEERCKRIECWDEKCFKVIDDIARKKQSHEESLLRDTIRKIQRKQKRAWDTSS